MAGTTVPMRRRFALALAFACATAAPLHAQNYPNKPIKTALGPGMFGEAAKSLGYHPFPLPVATSSAPYTNPEFGSPEKARTNLREGARLLREAGFEVRNQRLMRAVNSEPLSVEILLDNPQFERIVLFYKPNLERLGVNVTVRTVDDAQYQNRLRSWDYDIIIPRP